MKNLYTYLFAVLILGVCFPASAMEAMEKRVKPDTELIDAAKENNLNKVKDHLQNRADVDQKDDTGRTALIYASRNGFLPIVECLLDAQADVNAKSDKHWTALKEAVVNGHLSTVICLTEAGANVNEKSGNNWTALMWAAEKGHLEMVNHFLALGSNANEMDETKLTPLLIASRNGHLNVVQHLIEAGADMNHKDEKAETALMKAAWESNESTLKVVSYLIKIGAEVHGNYNMYNGRKRTPFTMLALRGHLEQCELIVEAMLGRPALCAAAFCLKNIGDNNVFKQLGIDEMICDRLDQAYRGENEARVLKLIKKIDLERVREPLLKKYFPEEKN